MRDHGGDLDRAQARFGAGDWVDLSTGINAVPYPVADIAAHHWGSLPTKTAIAGLEEAARSAYGARGGIVALAGAQAAIQLVPRVGQGRDARVVTPTYNEHAGALRGQGWQVTEVAEIDGLRGADAAVVVSPNNPDGRVWPSDALLDVARDVGLLVVDESFGDVMPEASILPHARDENLLVLRSFGKFYGLAGVRLGFACGPEPLVAQMRAMAGPWAVSGPAVALGTRALQDGGWQEATRTRLAAEAVRLDTMAARTGWSLVGGCDLFRTYETGDAEAAQERLARAHIWSRIFPYSKGWLRLGLPGQAAHWARLEAALAGEGQ